MKNDQFILNKEEAKEMFLTNKDSLYRYILVKTANPHLSEDVVADSFVKFFKFALNHKINKNKAKNLLFTIATNTLKDHFRKQKKITFVSIDKENNKKSEFLNKALADKHAISAVTNAETNEKIENINYIAKDLPQKQKEAFFLRFTQNLNFAEIAKIQKTSVSTALSRVRYSVNKIKKSLNVRGIGK